MTEPPPLSYPADDLRGRIPEKSSETATRMLENQDTSFPEEIRELFHELQVHRIELEMQNEELLQAHEKMEALRDRYFELYELAPAGYVTLSESGLILETNLKFATLLGTARGVLLGQPFSRLVFSDDQDIYYRCLKQWKGLPLIEIGAPHVCELRLVKNDGTHFWARLDSVHAKDADAELMYRVVISDITERRQAEQALRGSEEKYRLIADNTADVISVLDMNLKYTYVSPSIERLTGFTVSEAIGRTLEEVLTPESLKRARKAFERAMELEASGTADLARTRTLELEEYRKDGSTVWVEVNVILMRDREQKPTGVLAITRDITERRAAEALRYAEIRYRALFEYSPHGVLMVDPETGRALDANDVVHRQLGYTREEFLALKISDYEALERPEEIARHIQKILRQGNDEFETQHRTKSGEIRNVHVWAKTLELRGRVLFYVIFEDITDRKRAEEEKANLDAQNRQLLKTESLSRMAGAIAHHFNNQLQIVMGNLELAMSELIRGEPAVILTEAMKAARKAAEVSGLMLTYLGQTPGKCEPLDLSETCRRSLPMLRLPITENIVLEAEFPSPGPTIRANAIQILQVLTQLIINAWEAIGEGRGTIHLAVKTVAAKDIPEARRFPVDRQPLNSAHACLEISDTGSGIAQSDIEKIFDPFFTTKFTGRGLGLSVVLGIVRAHGGVITVESQPGKGSVFRVFLPVSGEAICREQEKSVQAPEIEAGGTVLLVEDDDQVRKMALAMLTHLNFTVREAGDGVDAIEVFQQHRDEICCVFCDLTMPRMNGWETLAALRKLSPDIPVVLASGYDEAHVMSGDHAEWPQAFIGKPYQLSGLSDAIHRALAAGRKTGRQNSSEA
ncbi:MAG: PAS domain S-box protein [Deltaproteobacteria bacterium]|nr:PAS domain S-box protein [Deltaproteobacteria bacterium]